MWRILALLTAVLTVAGCSGTKPAAEPVKEYLLAGTIIRINEPSHVVTVKHGPIRSAAGELWMEPMTMDFPVRDSSGFSKLKVGLKIRAKVKQSDGNYDYWIEQIEVE